MYVAENTAKVDPSIRFGNEENLQVFRDLLDFCYRNAIDTQLLHSYTRVRC